MGFDINQKHQKSQKQTNRTSSDLMDKNRKEIIAW